MLTPFRIIFRLSLGDFVAKAISFFVFIHLARALGVQAYGVLEFALSVLAYLLLVCDAGLELWGTREVARGEQVTGLVARIVAIRLLVSLAVIFCLGIALLLPVFPPFPNLSVLLALFGFVLFAQAIDLRWIFMGKEQMQFVAIGLIIAQVIFAASVFIFVHDPSDVLWVPVFHFLGTLSMTLFLFYRFFSAGYRFRFEFSIRGVHSILGPALTLGVSRGLALLSYNFDALLLGFMISSAAVGLYSAAYRPVTVFLVLATTFYLGLFPVLSRAYSENFQTFLQLVRNSQQLSATLAIPIGVCGFFLAEPLVELLYGASYQDSVPVLQILACSASLVFVRGTFRQALCAAGHQGRDLLIAAQASGTNVVLNLLLIPVYGMIGAALATLVSEILWVVLAARAFEARVSRARLLPSLLSPTLAGVGMIASFLLAQTWAWLFQALFASVIYIGILVVLNRSVVPLRWHA